MIAISNGGAIPDTALYKVILQPEEVQIATLDEHFAVDSSPGDVILLGNMSWRVQRIESSGQVHVEDAHGAPPSLPFWTGEAPRRTDVLSDGVSDLRDEISKRTETLSSEFISPAQPEVASTGAWLMQECGLSDWGAQQLVRYIVTGRAVLGAVPTKKTIIAERFFDEGGGMQLILHAPFGGRVNKAWGLALRKRFCRGFNFELQAAATDNGINISLAEQHSFPLSDVFQFLTEMTTRTLLEQASLAAPVFKTRWRWAAGRSLQLLRNSNGKRIAPQVQRTRSEDLLASVFPQAAACFENIEGDIQIPDHPLVREVMKDVLQEAMDLDGLLDVLRGIQDGSIRCLAVDTPVPSQFAHELINANPYAFLDEAGLEERRTRAVSLNSRIPSGILEHPGQLDPTAVATIRSECWPDIRDEHELHDLLMSVVALPVCMIEERARHWPEFYQRLERSQRAQSLRLKEMDCWVASERVNFVQAIWSGLPTPVVAADDTIRKCVQGWIQILGPVTANQFAANFSLDPKLVFQAFVGLETQGLLMRGRFERAAVSNDFEIEWCERRILQRIHKLTIGTRRRQIESIAPSAFMRWLLGWQHLAPQTQVSGEDGLLEVIAKLEGFEAPAIEWEKSIFPFRVANYDPRWLDQLCLSGVVGWGRVSPHPAFHEGNGQGPRRVIPTNAFPITFFLRDSAAWLDYALHLQQVEETNLVRALTPNAFNIRDFLKKRGACFAEEIQRALGVSSIEVQYALWELAAAGLAAADGFDQLRAIIDSDRRQAANASHRKTRSAAGRWSLFGAHSVDPKDALEQARHEDIAIESAAQLLLNRYGIVFRDLLVLESNTPRWGLLLRMLRRLEDRGQIRGGRFVSGFGGEQFALPEVLDSVRAPTNSSPMGDVTITGADPMNLIGVLIPGERVGAIPGRSCIVTSQMLQQSGAMPFPQRSGRRISFARPSTQRQRVPSLQAELI